MSDTVTITWELSTDGQAWDRVGEVQVHHIYVLNQAPVQGVTLYRTLLELAYKADGILAGSGDQAVQSVVDKIWEEFSDNQVYRYEDGQILKYWNGGIATAVNTAELLSSADANGQCGSWASLFTDALGAQGISATMMNVHRGRDPQTGLYTGGFITAPPNWGTADILGFHVLDIQLPNGGLLLSGNVTFQPQAGPAAQGVASSPSSFRNHFIVQFGNRLYDPSYGWVTPEGLLTLEDAKNAWEAHSVKAIYDDDVTYIDTANVSWLFTGKRSVREETLLVEDLQYVPVIPIPTP